MSKMFKDPATGNTIRFTQTASETGGALFEVEVAYTGHSTKPPAHFHPKQEERFEVLEGSITVEMQGQTRVYASGETFIVPAGVHHAMWNADDPTVVMKWQTLPALHTQQLFETLWGLQRDGKLNTKKPNLARIAVIFRTFRDEIRLTNPSEPVQTVLFTVLSAIGRLMGYRARYSEYSA